MLFLAIGLLVVGVIVACLAGYQVLFVGIDALRGMAVRPRQRPVDVMLYVLTVLGILAIIVGIILLHAGVHA
jgi:hypothetical protein